MSFSDFNVHRVLHAIKQRWLIAVTIFLICGVVFTYRALTIQSVYQASCKMEFSASGNEVSLDSRSLIRYSSYILQSLYLTTQKIIMLSDPVMNRVVTSLNLADSKSDYAFNSARGMVAGSLSIERLGDSQIFVIKSRHGDPQMARDIANATAEVYIRYSYEKKLDNYKMSIEWLDEELVDLKGKLERAQRKLMEFVEREQMTGTISGNGNQNTVERSNVLDDIEGLIQKLHGQKIEQELVLARMKEKYTPQHPSYQKMEREIKLLARKITEEEGRRDRLKSARDQEIIRSKKKEIEYSILKREVEINKEIYNALIRKYKETDVGSAIAQTDATIIERAKLPGWPIYPNRRMLIMLSWLVGLFFGVGCCLFLEYIDTTLKTPQDVEEYLQLPLLAVIEREKVQRTGLIRFVNDEEPHRGEACRILRTNLNFSFPKGVESRVIMVGSTQKGEGKSTVALNLGLVTAELKQRTIIVDGDLRARSLTRYHSMTEALGVTSYLVGEANLEQVIVKTDVPNLDIMPAGPMPPRPSTLLDSQRMVDLIQTLRNDYDEVIVDAPPVNIVIDASILATMADGVIMVIEAGGTSRYLVKRAIEQLDKTKARVCGFVLNKFNKATQGYYGSYDYYGYYGGDEEQVGELDELESDKIDEQAGAVAQEVAKDSRPSRSSDA